MKRKFLTSIILTLFLLHISSQGDAYQSVLVKSDDSQEILISSTTDLPKDDVGHFLEQNRIYTVEDYARWLEQNIHYQKVDENQDWASWQLTLNRRYGDCKNISALNVKILERLNYHPIIIGYKTASEGHVLTVFFKNGRMNVFDNTAYHVTSAKSIDEISAFLFQKGDIEMVFEVSLNPMAVKPLYSKMNVAAHFLHHTRS